MPRREEFAAGVRVGCLISLLLFAAAFALLYYLISINGPIH